MKGEASTLTEMANNLGNKIRRWKERPLDFDWDIFEAHLDKLTTTLFNFFMIGTNLTNDQAADISNNQRLRV